MFAITKLATSKQWNKAFTNILRENDRTVWGNWTLNPAVIAGAVGLVDPETGEFTVLGNLPGALVTPLVASQNWFVESSGVRRTEASVEFKGGYKDPSSGLKVDVGTKVDWSFAEENSLSSNGRVTGRSVVNDVAIAVQEQFDYLYQRAKAAGHTTPDGIAQGFGVVTQTWNCCGAINLGSLEKSSNFGLVGSVDGAAAMTGVGSVDAGVKGSYKEVMQSKAFESHMFPAEKNTAPLNDIAISYNFASFDGHVLMPRWAGILTGLNLVFDNNVGCSYYSTCTAEYDLPDGKGGFKTEKKEVSMTGGLTRTIGGIPLSACNMRITVALTFGGEPFRFRWDNPLSVWLNGQVTFDITGFWPGGPNVRWRT